MPTTATVAVCDEWFEHPIVKRVQDMAPEGASARHVLIALSDTLNELEDRFPGMPFSEILGSAERPQPIQVAQELKLRGVSDADLALICESRTGQAGSASLSYFDLRDLEAAHAGVPGAELERQGWPQRKAKEVCRMRQNVSGNELKWARLILDQGWNVNQVVRELGVPRYQVRVGLAKVVYRRWLQLPDQENVLR